MLAQSHARKPAPPLAARGMWLRLHGGPDAFGSALGDAVVGSIQRNDATKSDDPLGDFIKQNEQKWAQVSPYPRSDEMPLTAAQKSAMAAGRGPRKADDAQAWADNSGYPQPVGATVEQIRVGQTRMWKMTTPDGQVSLSDRYPSAAERGDLPRDESLNPVVGTPGPRSASQWDAFSPGLLRMAPDSVPTSGPSFFDQRVPFLADAIDFTKTGIERYAPKSTQGALNFGLDMAVGDGTVGATMLLATGPLAKIRRIEGTVASEIPLIKRGTQEWANKVDELAGTAKGKINIRTETASDAKALLQEARGGMDRRTQYTSDSYRKGYEVHNQQNTRELGAGNDLQHLKWRDGKAGGHIYYDKPN